MSGKFYKNIRTVERNTMQYDEEIVRTKVKVRMMPFQRVIFLFVFLYPFHSPIFSVTRFLIFSLSNAWRKLALIALGRGILPAPYAQGNSAATRLPERPERNSRKSAYVARRSFFGRHDRLTLYRHASPIA